MTLAHSQKLGVPAVLTALIGTAAGVLGSAAFSYWHEPHTEVAGKPSVVQAAGDNASTAVHELRTMLELERRHRRDNASALVAATAEHSAEAEAEPAPLAEPELTLEEQAASHIEEHRVAMNEHAREPKDPGWADNVESDFFEDLNALPKLGGHVTQIDCRTTTCTADVEWNNYDAALGGYAEVLHASLQTNCSKATILPEPSDREAPYRASFVFDCESTRTGD